jgi:hypothetical protein
MVGTARRAVRASQRDAAASEEFCPAPGIIDVACPAIAWHFSSANEGTLFIIDDWFAADAFNWLPRPVDWRVEPAGIGPD